MCNENSSYYAVDPTEWYNKNKGNQDLINKGMRDPNVSMSGIHAFFVRAEIINSNKRLYTPENTKGIEKCDVKIYPDGILKGKQEVCQSVLNGRLNQASGFCEEVDGQYPYNYAQMEEYLKDKKLKVRDFQSSTYMPRTTVQSWETPISSEIGVNLFDIKGGKKPKSKSKSLTLYYADWCPHCHDMMPEWNKLGKNHKGIKVEKFEENETDFKVDGFPTIIFRDGKKVEKYEGDRSKKAIVSYLKNKLS